MWINVSNDLVLNECLATWYFCEKKTCAIIVRYWGVGRVLWLSRVAQLVAAWQRESGGRMRKWRGHGERMRKWRNIHSLYFLIISSLSSISCIKNCLILSQNVKYGTFLRVSPKTWHMRYEKIILGCEKAPQVVWAWARKSQTLLEKIVAIFCSYSGMAEIQNLAGDTELQV